MTEAADKRGEEEEEEIVASTSALDIVKSWLGPPAEGEEDLDRGDDPMLKPRPARLGLGAKFLSHNKAMAAMGEVEKRLSQRIKRTQEDIKEPEQASTSGSDEEEGAAARRSNAARAPVQPKKTARAGFSKSQLISELAARKEQDTEVPKKKRRKKKKKKTSHQAEGMQGE